MEAIELTLKKMKVDCLYGKKKHFNAADRNENYHYKLGIPLIAINILTGTLLFKSLAAGATDWWKYIPLVLSFLAAFLSGFQTYFNFSKRVEGHRNIANRYLAQLKRIDRLQAFVKDGQIKESELVKKVDDIGAAIDAINKDAGQFPTSQKDFDKAKAGIEAGEEGYTEDELKL